MHSVARSTIRLLFLTVGGCFNAPTKPVVTPKPAPLTITTPSSAFGWSNANQKNEFFTKVKTLKKGATIGDVVRILGDGFTTQPYDLGEIDETYGTQVTYDLQPLSGSAEMMLYPSVTLRFGKDDRLISVDTAMKGPGLANAKHVDSGDMTLEGVQNLVDQARAPNQPAQLGRTRE
jgi:hypothetical protein